MAGLARARPEGRGTLLFLSLPLTLGCGEPAPGPQPLPGTSGLFRSSRASCPLGEALILSL